MNKQMVMRGWKGLICFMAACVLVLALAGNVLADVNDPVAAKIKKFPDVPSSHWGYIYVVRLTNEGAITGMPDGTFGPERSITRAEFVAVVARALLGKLEAPPVGQHWAVNIMKAAESSGMLEAGEFAADTWNTPINRQEMAKIMARATQYVQKEAPIADTAAFAAKVTDFASIGEGYQAYVAQACAKGIVAGYPDGSFGGGRQATRAEASTMVVRLLDPMYRECEITFDPKTDVAADGRMKLAKAEQYMMKNLRSLKFFKENGKYYVECNLTELPEGFVNWLGITVEYKEGTGLPVDNYDTNPLGRVIPLPKAGYFKQQFEPMTGLDKVEYVQVKMAIRSANTNVSPRYECFWTFLSSNDNRIASIDYTNHEEQTNKFYDFSKIFTWE